MSDQVRVTPIAQRATWAKQETEHDRSDRDTAPTICLDLRRLDVVIHRELRQRYPRVIDLWWELEPDERTGFVYSGARVLARLIQS